MKRSTEMNWLFGIRKVISDTTLPLRTAALCRVSQNINSAVCAKQPRPARRRSEPHNAGREGYD